LSHFYLGRHEEALRRVNQAIHLSPSDPHAFFFDMALIMPYLMSGDCARAIEAGRRAIELNPLFSSTYKGYLSALGWIRRPREAREVLDRLLALEPRFSVEAAVTRSPLKRPEDIARYAEGLRLAGLRERSEAPTATTLAIEYSVIDLVPEAPHSSVTIRDGSYSRGKLGNDTDW
jgi:tetratricopeptide (TPR) repeat protein